MSDLESRLAAKAALEQMDRQETGGVQHGFQLPGWIWQAMIAAYVVFFAAITAATGRDGPALFAIVVSVGFASIYFSLAFTLASVKGRERRSPLHARDGVLQTWCGPMDRTAVAAQVLTVPVCLAIFATAIFVIRMSITG